MGVLLMALANASTTDKNAPQSLAALKVITVRSTGFDAYPDRGSDSGSTKIEAVDTVKKCSQSNFVKEELAQSRAPPLLLPASR